MSDLDTLTTLILLGLGSWGWYRVGRYSAPPQGVEPSVCDKMMVGCLQNLESSEKFAPPDGPLAVTSSCPFKYRGEKFVLSITRDRTTEPAERNDA